MFDELTSAGVVGISVVVFLGLAFTGLFWLRFPRWFRTRFGGGLDKDAVAEEEGYRQALAQVFGLPLAIIGVFGALITVHEGLSAYRKAVATDFQDRYKRGFKMLASPAAGTRIGGLFVLEGLIKQADLETKAGKDAANFRLQLNTILQAVAAFGVERSLIKRSDSEDPVVAPDALIALRVIGESNSNVEGLPLDLRGGYFVGSFVPHANLEHINLYRANFEGSDIYQGRFYESNLRDSNFNGANLAGSDFSHAGFLNSTFCPARNWATASLMNDAPEATQMASTQFYDASGVRVFFNGAMLQGAIFNNSTFAAVSFVAADLEGAAFVGARLEDADFTSATMKRVNFGPGDGSAVLNNAKFDGADISSVRFDGATITGVSFRNAHAKDASFVNTMIDRTDFTGANLIGAHFKDAKITASIFKGAIVDKDTFANATIDKSLLTETVECNTTKIAGENPSAPCAKLHPTPPPNRSAQHCADNPAVRSRLALTMVNGK